MFRSTLTPELAYGQTVIVSARWLLVLAGLLVTIWNPDTLGQLRLQIGVVLAVAIANFAMHAQLLRRRPQLRAIAFAASIGDLLMISLLVASQGGFASNTYVFFFPAVLAIAVAFPTTEALLLSGTAVLLLAGVSLNQPKFDLVLERALALGAVALIGNAYWRLHRSRIVATSSAQNEAAQDLFWGQLATLWARWALILGGALLVLSRAATTEQLAFGILPVVALLVLNFYLHGRYLLERPANAAFTLTAAVVDLVAIGVLFVSWADTSLQGAANPLFLLLYPLVFAVGLVFPPRLAWTYAAAAMAGYTVLLLSGGAVEPKTLVVRLITVGAMAGLGSLYWRIVRRQGPLEGTDDSTAQLAWRAARAS